MTPHAPSSHASAELLAAFVDDRLTAAEREGMLAHLAECAVCRGELTAAHRDLAAAAASPRGSRVWVPAVAAAVLLIGVIPFFRADDRAAERRDSRLDPAVRRVSPEGNATIQIVSPSESDTIGAAPLILAWHSAGSNAVYRVLLMDAAGGVRWTANTEDTTAILPDSVALTSGEAFFWSVDALLAGGRSATTRVQTFIVR